VIGKCEVIYSAFHDNSAASESQEKMLTALTTSKSLYPRCYSHEESDVLYNSLLELFKAIRSGDANAFQNRISSMAEIISGKYKSFPWRFEYFLELSLRLLAVDEESVSVVRNIIGCEGQPGQYELNCNLTETELEIFKELKLVIEAHLRSVQFKDMTDPQCYHRAIKILSDLSAEQKREYLRTPYLVR
jgi:hypothetical protein